MASSRKLNGSVAAVGSPWYSTTLSLGCTWDGQGRAAEEPREDRLGKPKPESSMSSEEGAARAWAWAWAEGRCVAFVVIQTTTGRCWIEKRGPIVQGLLGQDRDSFSAVYFH